MQAGYLFPEIGRRRNAYLEANPDAQPIISLGIGDTTMPVPEHILNGLKNVTCDSRGYGKLQDQGTLQSLCNAMLFPVDYDVFSAGADTVHELELAAPATALRGGRHRKGGDGDRHGCVRSAGFEWCAAEGKCIRRWEEGIKSDKQFAAKCDAKDAAPAVEVAPAAATPKKHPSHAVCERRCKGECDAGVGQPSCEAGCAITKEGLQSPDDADEYCHELDLPTVRVDACKAGVRLLVKCTGEKHTEAQAVQATA